MPSLRSEAAINSLLQKKNCDRKRKLKNFQQILPIDVFLKIAHPCCSHFANYSCLTAAIYCEELPKRSLSVSVPLMPLWYLRSRAALPGTHYPKVDFLMTKLFRLSSKAINQQFTCALRCAVYCVFRCQHVICVSYSQF